MATLPFVTENPNKVFSALKMYSRAGQFPLDPTSVFETKAQAEAYINETGSYAYAGQVLAVLNGTLSTKDSVDVTLYVIRKDRTLQEMGRDLVFETKAAAEAYVTTNTDYLKAGTVVSVLNDSKDDYIMYVITPKKGLSKVSFDAASDLPTVSWDDIEEKPDSTTTQIDASVTFYERFSVAADTGVLSFDNKRVAYFTDLTWDNIEKKPDFASLYAAKSHTHEAADIKSIDFDNTTVSGVLPLSAIPSGAKEEVFTAESLDELATSAWLTGKSIDKNDWISVASVTDDTTKIASAKMYYVTDPTKLGTADYAQGIKEIPLGTAAAVAWANVTDKPTTVAKSGLTDALSTGNTIEDAKTASAANAGKLVKLDSTGKMRVNITGDAQSLQGKVPSDFAAAKHNHVFADITDTMDFAKITKSTLPEKAADHGITDVVLNGQVITDGINGTVDDRKGKLVQLNDEANLPVNITGSAQTLQGKVPDDFATKGHNHSYNSLTGSLDWKKIDDTTTPTTLAGYGITDGVNATTDVVTVATKNKLLKLNDDAKLPASITGSAEELQGHSAEYFATADHNHALADLTGKLDWSKIEGTPTSVDGYGITDAVKSGEVVTTATANKILKLDANKKLPASITGDAATVGGRTAASFADASHTHAMSEVTGLTDEISGIKGNAATETGSTVSYIDLSKTTFKGKISLDNIPAGALERMEIVASVDAMLLLTAAKVQQGDLVKVKADKAADQKVYYVKDEKLLSSDGTTPGDIKAFEEFPMGTAASVPWSGVTDAPDFANLYAAKDHTHTAAEVGAVPTTDVVTKATANKILKLDANGKLPTSITGDAATLEGNKASAFAKASHTHTASEITDFTTAVNNILTPAIDAKGHVVVGSVAPASAKDLNKNDMYIQLL